MRQIGIAISVTLKPNLHDANDRQEHDQIPEPTDEEIGLVPTEHVNNPGCCDQKCGRKCDLPECEPIIGMRIKHGEIHRPEDLPNIRDVSNKRVLKPPDEWQLADRRGRLHLQNEGNDRRGSGKREERNFFKRHAPE